MNNQVRKFPLRLLAIALTALASLSFAQEAAGQIQLVAVQMTLDLDDYWTAEAFEAKIRQRMEAVAAATDSSLPTLVVFPEDVGLMLVVQGMQERLEGIASISEAISTVVSSQAVPLAWTRLIRWKSWVPALFLRHNRRIAEQYFTVFGDVAEEHGVYLVAGSAVLPPYRISDGEVDWQRGPERHVVHNTSYLFGPDGSVLGSQDKVELIALETADALDLTPGTVDGLQVFDTPLGVIGIAICLDAFSEKVTLRLAELGAQILVQPSANPAAWDDWQQEDWLRSAQLMTAGNGRFDYAINPMLNGPLWDVAFFGQSSITARTASDSVLGYADMGGMPGFISVAGSADSEEILVAVVPHPDLLD